MADVSTLTKDQWMLEVRNEQQFYWECFHGYQWDVIAKCEKEGALIKLHKKLAFALFGGPTQKRSVFGYTKEQEKIIRHLAQKIVDNQICSSDYFHIAFVFVNGFRKSHGPFTELLVRVPDKTLNKHLFIDSCLRVYKGWNDFLSSNCLPASLLCYPFTGVYVAVDGEVRIEFKDSIACSIGRQAIKVFDITGVALSLGTLGVGAAAALTLPIAAPILVGSAVTGVAVGAYQTGRSIFTLSNRSKHSQTIGLGSAEARNAWLGVVTGPLGAVASGATMVASRIAQSGEALSLTARVGLGAAAGVSCTTSVLSVANSVANIAQKAHAKEAITEMDILHVVASVLFFSNAVISTNQARQLINNAPSGQQSFSTWLGRQYRKIGNVANGAFETERLVNYFSNDDVFSAVVLPGIYIAANTYGISSRLVNVCGKICTLIWKATQQFISGCLTKSQYLEKCVNLAKELWNIIENDLEEIVDTICRIFGAKQLQDVQVDGRCILEGMVPQQKVQLASTLHSATLTYQKKVIDSSPPQETHDTANQLAENARDKLQTDVFNIVKESAVSQGISTPQDFVLYTKFVSKFIHHQLDIQENEYQRALSTTKSFIPDINVEQFNRTYGIEGNRYDYFLNKIMKELSFSEDPCSGLIPNLTILYQSYITSLSAESSNESLDDLFSGGNVQLSVFTDRQGLGPNGCFTHSQCLLLAQECIGRPVGINRVSFLRSGTNVLMVFNDPSLEFETMLVAGFPRDGRISGVISLARK